MVAAARPDRNATSVAGAAGTAIPHDSAHLHVSGEATYTDDIPEPRGTLHLAVGMSKHAHARLKRVDLAAVRSAPGVVDVMVAKDIPGTNNCGPVVQDDPILAPGIVQYVGQAVFAVAARTVDEARKAVALAEIEYEELAAILDPLTAVEKKSFVLPSETLERGDATSAIHEAPHRLQGRVELGGQDQFYLEGQIAMALPREDGDLFVYSSTQHPGEVQHLVAHAIGRQSKDVVVECRRMGGAFGGKESQPALIACIAGLMANRTNKPCKLRLDRDVDMVMTGKRHDFVIDYDVGFDDDGLIAGVEFMFASRCGMSADLSGAINDRTMFHCDNAYYLQNVKIVSHRCKTHTVSNTAFRGFGGPQGMYGIEYVIDEIARYLGMDALDVRRKNFYGIGERDVTPYMQTVKDNILDEITTLLENRADYRARRALTDKFNAEHQHLKKGLALTPVKFGISFTATHLNQAGALLHVYSDGTVHLNHGGTEMGQGLFTKVAQVVADELQIDIDRIKITASDTSKVPNASATAASSGSDLNGKAAEAAARTVKQRMTRFAAEHFKVSEPDIYFQNNEVHVGNNVLSFAELAHMAWFARVSLSSTGFYRTPKINYDRSTFSGRPFYYFAYGAAVAEVLVDVLTGEYRMLRVDILHDCGNSLNPAIDMGQIEGGFIQGVGWLTTEELCWNARGELTTHAPSTYKIPVCSDVPEEFNVEIFESGRNREDTVFRSKAVGEPPLMLSLSVFHALRDAVAATGAQGCRPPLRAPATPEAVLEAIIAVSDDPDE
ncbi:MAG: xanthine dehydrogenase molybdopterin binding subunit [Woeseia sp.]|nr:xanthine dehydrogenase molybdopterin binding subunit [Woeseia sp.]MBT8096457.1 xanthine dehydrogenase molybdopterin binding subunit [Woeseia sp.]NNE62100.1 xanthine dehydrogenase molybdopterin binding subunit [Woeseia sp.]NNL55304.1 xanthine dehydrogenase molybdopterin binding subunit [Woeseia sp.]